MFNIFTLERWTTVETRLQLPHLPFLRDLPSFYHQVHLLINRALRL